MKKLISSFCLAVVALSSSLLAAPYAVGDTVKSFEAQDQHGNAFKLENSVTFLLLTDDMETGKKANQALDAKGAEFLPKHHAVYVANIHGMPGIGRFFAFKKMKKYAHRIIYADTEGFMAAFPVQANQVTVLKLDAQNKVQSVSYWDPEKQELESILK